MARVARENWKERIRDPKIECMSRDEMSALQSERLVKQVKNVYDNVAFYREKMDAMGLEPGDIKGIEDITKLPFTEITFAEQVFAGLIAKFHIIHAAFNIGFVKLLYKFIAESKIITQTAVANGCVDHLNIIPHSH